MLPLRRELFDLAIIDEATQCDIASSLPILQRAARSVSVGDPHQLRHLSFLSRERQQALIMKHGIPSEKADIYDYRAKSILDLVSETIQTQEQVRFLDEHYRSAPPIIAFSNQTFYGGALRVMTDKPGEAMANRVVLRRCAGHRRASGQNEAEALLVIEDVERQIESERDLSPNLCHSIGVLSPFRSQVDFISDQLAARLPLEAFQRHDLLIGTAHTFQGEERDLMFISLAVGSESHRQTLRFLDRPDVFNVSITRARAQRYIYISINPELLESESLLAAYLRSVGCSQLVSADTRSENPADRPDFFISEVARQLGDRGFSTWPAYPLAGLTMDLIVTR